MAFTSATAYPAFHAPLPLSIGDIPSGSAPRSGRLDDRRIQARTSSEGNIVLLLFETRATAAEEDQDDVPCPGKSRLAFRRGTSLAGSS